ncbi:hypothetical protein SH2C18_27760 [Clostridium sediminicola]|uniref:FMN-binding protein n=1 Tax=Clostridium sediminicola TaxID=3114879 RepID=UPI0031F20C35
MKKIILGLLLITLNFSLVACTNRNEVEETKLPQDKTETTEEPISIGKTEVPESKYKDGEYVGKGDSWEYGSEDATVVIKEGLISDITLRKLDKEGNEVNYDEWSGEEKDGKIYPNLKNYRLDLARKMLENQTYEVDSISGATVSSDNWKMAVKRAIEKAKI